MAPWGGGRSAFLCAALPCGSRWLWSPGASWRLRGARPLVLLRPVPRPGQGPGDTHCGACAHLCEPLFLPHPPEA